MLPPCLCTMSILRILSSNRCSHAKAPHVKLLEVHCNIPNFAVCQILMHTCLHSATCSNMLRQVHQVTQQCEQSKECQLNPAPWHVSSCDHTDIGPLDIRLWPWLLVKHWWWTAVQSCLSAWDVARHNSFLQIIPVLQWFCKGAFPFDSLCFLNVCSPSSAPVQQVLEWSHAGPPSWIGPRLKQHRCCWMRLEVFIQQKTESETEKLRKSRKRKRTYTIYYLDGKRW